LTTSEEVIGECQVDDHPVALKLGAAKVDCPAMLRNCTPSWLRASRYRRKWLHASASYIGNGPGLWLRLQAAHDAWHAERDVDVSAVPSLERAG